MPTQDKEQGSRTGHGSSSGQGSRGQKQGGRSQSGQGGQREQGSRK